MKNDFDAVRKIIESQYTIDIKGNPLRASWQIASDKKLQEYLELMLDRLGKFSSDNIGNIDIPNTVYHGSIRSGIKNLDPTRGQGYGAWWQSDLHEAANFAISRSTDPRSIRNRKFYDGAEPTVYAGNLDIKQLAVFPNEDALYGLAIPFESDSEEIRLNNWAFDHPHLAREVLLSQGYDGIYLLAEKTIATTTPDAHEIVGEYPAIPIFNKHVRPRLEAQHPGKDYYAHVPKDLS